jgi:hypothetical protein
MAVGYSNLQTAPSTLADRSIYFFLDDGKQPIRELKPKPEGKPKLATKGGDFMGEFLDMFGSTKTGGELS